MKFTMTQEDIDHGLPQDCSRCPVARCIKRALEGTDVRNVEVNAYVRLIGRDAREVIAALPSPKNVCEFIGNFDAGNPVTPIEFHLPVEEYV